MKFRGQMGDVWLEKIFNDNRHERTNWPRQRSLRSVWTAEGQMPRVGILVRLVWKGAVDLGTKNMYTCTHKAVRLLGLH